MSREYTLITEPDLFSLATRTAGFVADRARTAVADYGRFTFAASGGKTPWAMFAELARRNLPWASVEIYQVDERVAPNGHPDRNLTHLRQCLSDLPVVLRPMPVTSPDLDRSARAASTVPGVRCWRFPGPGC